MARPPDSVALVARTHWFVGSVILASTLLVHCATRDLPRIHFPARTYYIAGGLGAFYLLTGTLVWFGISFGRALSRICTLLYLPRPSFGGRLWEIMNSAEYRAHFRRPRPEA